MLKDEQEKQGEIFKEKPRETKSLIYEFEQTQE